MTTTIAALLADPDASLTAMESYGYKLVTWQEFETAEDRPKGLMERALKYTEPMERSHVIYDPEDDDEGWMLIGEREAIIRETVEDLIGIEPPEGPLSPKELVQ